LSHGAPGEKRQRLIASIAARSRASLPELALICDRFSSTLVVDENA
jgi:hypothetical protein